MERNHSWLWKVVRLAIGVLIASFVFAALIHAVNDAASLAERALEKAQITTRSSEEELRRRNALPGVSDHIAERVIDRVSISITIDEEELSGRYILTFDRRSRMLRRLQMLLSLPYDEWDTPVAPYVPAARLGDQYIGARDAEVLLFANTPTAQVRGNLRSVSLSQLKAGDVPLTIQKPWATTIPESVDLSFNVSSDARDDFEIVPRNATPLEQHHGHLFFSGYADLFPLELVVRYKKPPAPMGDDPEREHKTIAQTIQSLNYFGGGVLEQLIFALALVLPFALVYWLARQNDDLAPLAGFAFLYIVLYAGVGLTRGAGSLLWASRDLEDLLQQQCSVYLGDLLGGATVVEVLFMSAMWPYLVRRWRRSQEILKPHAGTSNYVSVGIAALFIAAGVYAVSVLCTAEYPVREELWWLGGVIIVAIAASMPLASELSSLAFALVLALYGLLFIALERAIWQKQDLKNLLLTATAIPLAVAIYRTVHHLFRRDEQSTPWPFSRRAAAAALAVVAVYFLVRPIGKDMTTIGWTLTDAAVQLALAVRIVVVLALVLFLKHSGAPGDTKRNAGAVLIALSFFLPPGNWFYLLVIFSLGWLLLRHWTFVDRDDAAATPESAAQAVRGLIRLNEEERALRLMKKEMAQQVAKGTTPFTDYVKKTEELETDIILRRKELTGPKDRVAVLAIGTQIDPWERAIEGARTAALLAIPWIAFFIYKIHLGSAPERGFQWLSIVASSVAAIAQWPIIGFFFCYFYPRLRGDDGLEKGFYLFLTLAGPRFAATGLTLATSSSEWSAFAIWALQLFVVCILTGLIAGDYLTLRSAKLGWRHLTDVHNLGALTAWASSLAIAIGAGITTAASSNIATLLSWVVNSPK